MRSTPRKRVYRLCVMLVSSASLVATAQAEDVLTTSTGAPLKAITKQPTAVHREPDPGSQAEPLDIFQFRYCLPVEKGATEKTKNGFYRVANGKTLKHHQGWIPAAHVVEWSHAQVAAFAPRVDRDRVLFFSSWGDAEQWFKEGGDIEEQAISREPDQLQSGLFPLLDVREFEHQGETVEAYKVAYLSKGASSSPQPKRRTSKGSDDGSEHVTKEDFQRDFRLQVVFVLDSTRSMQPWIDAMKEVIRKIATELSRNDELRGRIELALVCFRDDMRDASAAQAMQYVTKVVSEFTSNHDEFLKALRTVSEATIGSEDAPENVLGGLDAATGLAWKDLAYKHIVLIGDASAHLETTGYKNPDRLTIPGILASVQPTGAAFRQIQIHGLRVLSSSSDQQRCKQHFASLTAGRDFPGLHNEYAGPADANAFIDDLIAKLLEFADVTQDVVRGDFDKIEDEAKRAKPDSERKRLLGPILPMLDAARRSPNAPPFTEGYAVVLDRKGNRALEPHVLVEQNQLKLFASGVDFCANAVQDAGDPGNRDVLKIVKSLQLLATNISMKEDIDPDMPLSKLLSLILGIPVRSQIFSLTPRQLANMTAKDFAVWLEQVRASEQIVRSHVDNGAIWFQLGRSAKPSEKHAFVKVSDLP